MRLANTDLLGALVGLALTALFWFNRGNLGELSARFPNAIMLFMLVFSLALLLKGFIRPERYELFKDVNLRRVFITGMTLFVWAFGIRYLGFYVSSVFVFAFLTYYLARPNRDISLATFILWLGIICLEVGLLYLVFTRVLYVPLPRGIFF